LLLGLEFFLEEPRRVVIAGDPKQSDAAALLRAAHSVYEPHKVILGTSGPVEPFAKTLAPKDAVPMAYVCTGTSCQPPAHDAAAVRRTLTGH
jgi:uncharacterized protein YyaL (SSP411 family)